MILNWSSFAATSNKSIDSLAKASLICAIFFAPLGTAPTYVFMGLTILAFLAAGGYRQRLLALKGNYFAYASLGLFALLCIGVLYSNAPTPDIQLELRKYVKLPFMLLAMTLLQDDKWRIRGLNAFLLAMLITLALSMASVAWPLPFTRAVDGNHVVFQDHIVQNLMMSFFVLVMLIRSRTQTNLALQFVYLALALFAIVNILVYVVGRTGHIALAVMLAVFIAFYIPSRHRWLSLLVSLLAGLAIFHYSDNFRGRVELAITEYQTRDSNRLSSVGQRLEFFEKSVMLIKERPVFGWGTGSYSTEYCRVAETEQLCEWGRVHPHNQFMAFGVQLGVTGILAYLTVLGFALRQAWRFNLPEKVMGIGLVGTLLVDSAFHAPLFLAREALFFTLMLAVVLSARPSSLPDLQRSK